ncbi:hypothetical protein A1O3_04757 [Capronia epimyces CBS 606.96]|uniref:Bacteriophage T5 Orf172 DNA-binding domain-containing protein n=1 Tax=Capronia epimyces CBS 606.96 TaxID=1182542 RepID=W9Y367_9EURO|nr:uncharacterized protein A1O3_04757 [Capronia epimyces CBS 606.96]EXJ84090.1 hypothetical protein A1O3_04757 [Capronia epimyces CBS 606.96]
MAYNPEVSFFIPYHELNTSRQRQCIFFTQKGARCRWDCEDEDSTQAVALVQEINAILPRETVSLDVLERCALLNCCQRARHQDRIEDLGLLTPLAERWYDEIQIRAQQMAPTARTSPARSSRSASARSSSISAPVILSEFRPHVKSPLPMHSVTFKLRERLDRRDFETGSLYIFDRASSPGHVKIGWTAISVTGRLDDWAKCGYTPNLLVRVDRVPHAQRVETLTHHELLKEWRRERQCKAPWCRKSHQEWFEVSKERAIEVLRDWAAFMKVVKPYDSRGDLEEKWEKFLKIMDDTHEVVTAKKMWEHHERLLLEKTALIDDTPDLKHPAEIKEMVGLGSIPKVPVGRDQEAVVAGADWPRVEQPSLKIEPFHHNDVLSQARPQATSRPTEEKMASAKLIDAALLLATGILSKTESVSKTESGLETKSLPQTEPMLQTESFATRPVPKTESALPIETLPKVESLPETDSVLPTETLPKIESLPETDSSSEIKIDTLPLTGPLLKTESFSLTRPQPTAELVLQTKPLSQTKPLLHTESVLKTESLSLTEPPSTTKTLATSEPTQKGVSGPQTPPVKRKPLPESARLPRSPLPLLPSTTSPQVEAQETKPSPSANTVTATAEFDTEPTVDPSPSPESTTLSATAESDTESTVVDPSPSPETDSLTPLSAPLKSEEDTAPTDVRTGINTASQERWGKTLTPTSTSTSTSTTQPHHNDEDQERLEGKPLGCDKSLSDENVNTNETTVTQQTETKTHDQEDNTAAQEEAETATESGSYSFDADETLVEDNEATLFEDQTDKAIAMALSKVTLVEDNEETVFKDQTEKAIAVALSKVVDQHSNPTVSAETLFEDPTDQDIAMALSKVALVEDNEETLCEDNGATLFEDQTDKAIAIALSKVVDQHSNPTVSVSLGKQVTGGLSVSIEKPAIGGLNKLDRLAELNGLDAPTTLQSEAPPVAETALA